MSPKLRVSSIDGQATVKSTILAATTLLGIPLNCGFSEPMTGIEPAYSAWEADVLPLNYIGDVVWEG